jgi:serine protease Do
MSQPGIGRVSVKDTDSTLYQDFQLATGPGPKMLADFELHPPVTGHTSMRNRFVYLSQIVPKLMLAILLFLAAAGSAHADYESARREFEKYDMQRQAKIFLGLIATGDFEGLSVFGFTKRMYSGVVAFQKREGLKANGKLSDTEIDLLVRRYQSFSTEYGIQTVRNPVSGAEALVPRALFDTESPTANGLDLERNDKKMSISFITYEDSDRSFRTLYDRFTRTSSDRFVEYKTIRPEYFVVSGLEDARHFYVFMSATPTSSTGFVVSWQSNSLVLGRKVSVLMANSFTNGTGNVAAPEEAPPQQTPEPPPQQNAAPPDAQKPVTSTGTGFRITQAGHVMTNYHVAGQCKKIRLHRIGETPVEAALVASDSVNDLAIIKGATPLPGTVAQFGGKGAVRAGSEIVVFGFPLTGLLSDSGNFTTGNITSMAGMGNDSRLFQISAPVQPGNSGGPVLDRKGNVVAVIVSKLNAMGIQNQVGDVPQNVNFAIKSNVALGFVEGIGILSVDTAKDATALDTPTLAEKAREFTFLIECNND